LKVKISSFLIIILMLSLCFIPSAFSEEIKGPSDIKSVGQKKPIVTETKPQETKQPEETEIESQPAEAEEAVPVEPEEEAPPEEAVAEEAVPAESEEEAPAEEAEAEEAVSVEPEEEAVPVKPKKRPGIQRRTQMVSGAVSFFFDDADVFEVIQTVFGDILKENYIVDPQVKGRVNFRTVTPIPKDEVLPIMEIILRLNGIGFVEEKGLYNIIPLDQVSKELVYAQIGKSPENVAIELFTFKNVDLKESMMDIENALGLNIKGGTVKILPVYRLNALLVVTSTKEQMQYIRKWVEVFDEMFMTARPKIYVYPLQNSKAAHIASLLQSIFSGGASGSAVPRAETQTPAGGASPTAAQQSSAARVGAAVVASGTGFLVSADTRIFADEVSNSLVILATPTDYDFIEETIKKLDTVARQVLIEGLIARVDLTDSFNFGFAWSLRSDINYNPWNIDLTGEMGQNTSLLTAEGAATLSGQGFTMIGTDPLGIVRLKLEALVSEGKAEVIASPHILITDNREASFQVGQQIPIPTSETNVTGTTNIQRTFQYKDIGIILKVKPQINESGIVSLEITQEVSSSATPVEEIATGTSNPVINKIEATTHLVAKDRQTIIIGGLIREDTTKSRSGIPFLKDIPILGYLFGTTSETKDRVELVILLTPHVIMTHDDAANVTEEYVDKFTNPKKATIDELIKERGRE